MEPQLRFIGMEREIERLRTALIYGDPLVLLGPQGSGKTRLIEEARRPDILYIPWEPTLHTLLIAIARALIAARHAGFVSRAKPGSDPEKWLAAQTSLRLKGLLWTAIESEPVTMVLDGVAGASFPAYRFLQRIYHTRGMALFAAARDVAGLGALSRLFWNPAKTLPVPPLHERDAERLFEAAADHFHLRELDLDEFRAKVLASGRGNPGQIIEMCRLAALPRYHAGRHIKFAPLRIDAVMKFAP